MAGTRSNVAAVLCLLVLLSLATTHAARIAAVKDVMRQQDVMGVERNPPPKKYKNTKPLIGILTQPCHYCPGKSYIAAGYVKWIESAGARAVPIRFYASDEELHRLFRSINGLVFPGGLTWLWLDSPYVIAARKLFNWALQANDKGNTFPIWGTCLGFQLLHILASNVSRNDLLVDTDSVAHPATLEFTAAANSSRLFGGMSPDLISKLADPQYNIAFENHMYGIPPPFYQKYNVLSQWYKLLTTTKDRNGVQYISSMEGIKYPFFGTQWHPEKPPFEFGMEEVIHSLDAIRVSQHLANVLVEHARMSPHKPQSKEEELAMLIYSTPPVFSARFEVLDEDNYDGPDITYYFDQKDKPPHGPDDDEGGDDGGAMLSHTSKQEQEDEHEEQDEQDEDEEQDEQDEQGEQDEQQQKKKINFWSTQGGFF